MKMVKKRLSLKYGVKKMKIYHYTDKNIKEVKTCYFAKNNYTGNDKKISGVNRSFFYTEKSNIEHRFKNKIKYYAKVKKTKIYNLNKDKNGYLNKFKNDYNIIDNTSIDKTLKYIADNTNYIGIYYKTGGLNIISLFEDIAVKRVKK